jgi:DUF1365 family protein
MNGPGSGGAMRMHDPAIYRAEVTHTRTGPIRHRLRHSVFYLYLDLYKLDDFARRSRIFSRNHFNLLSFFDRDHGCRDGRPIAVWVETQLKHAGFFDPQGRIFLLTLPRILGYVFNPISVYYCFDRQNQLIAVLHEVRNTFGELHGYVLPAHPSPQGLVHQETAKRFYVSPFMGMDALYRFRLNIPAEVLMIGIRATTVEGIGLAAFLRGRQRPLTDWELLRAVFAMPFMTVNVIASIHIHAMRLWLKGAIFHRKPPAPRQTVTIDPSEPAET